MEMETEMTINVGIEDFHPIAYCCNSGCWLVDHKRDVATYCCDVTFTREDWEALYLPTHKMFEEFCQDTD